MKRQSTDVVQLGDIVFVEVGDIVEEGEIVEMDEDEIIFPIPGKTTQLHVT